MLRRITRSPGQANRSPQVFDGNAQRVYLSVVWERPTLNEQWAAQVKADGTSRFFVSCYMPHVLLFFTPPLLCVCPMKVMILNKCHYSYPLYIFLITILTNPY